MVALGPLLGVVLGLLPLLLDACLAQLPSSGAAQRPETRAWRVLALGPPLLPGPCTSGSTYCELGELPATYPLQHVLRLASRARHRAQSAALVPLPTRNVTDAAIMRFLVLSRPSASLPAVAAKFTEPGEEEPLCLSQVRFVRPWAALNTALQWRFVLNMAARNGSSMLAYQQVVRVEVCLAEGEPCAIITDGRGTVCRQKFTQHRLLALSAEGEEYTDTFLFPSCCVCHALPPHLPYWRDQG